MKLKNESFKALKTHLNTSLVVLFLNSAALHCRAPGDVSDRDAKPATITGFLRTKRVAMPHRPWALTRPAPVYISKLRILLVVSEA